jgi:phospholipid transport system substrate-binding protein
MRKIEIIVAVLAAVGLMFAIVAEAAQEKISRYTPVQPVPGEAEVSAWQADRDWTAVLLDDEARLALATPHPQVARANETAGQTFDRLSRMETSAGPEMVDPNVAVQAVRRLGDEAIAVLNNASLGAEAKIAKFQQLLARDFDMALIARFALGRHWRSASSAEQQAYVDAFSRFVLKTYARQLADANIRSFQVVSSQLAGKRDVMVETRVVRSGGGILKLIWRLRSRGGSFRVIDVVAEGVSLALTKRQEFAAIIRANGGQVQPLINTLRNRAT